MSEHYPVSYTPVYLREPERPESSDATCSALLRLATLGAVVGGSAAAAANIRRVQQDEIDAGQALLDTGRTAVTSAAATAVAGAVATAVGNEGLARLGLLFATGTAVMYALQPGARKDAEESDP
jgi:hypothetical protein